MNILENPIILALFGVGVAIAGVGVQLIFQGRYIKNPRNKKLGDNAITLGGIWAFWGLVVLLFGIFYMHCA